MVLFKWDLELVKYTERKKISDCQGLGVRGDDWMQRHLRKLFEVMEIVYILIMVAGIQYYMFVKTYWNIYVNYTLLKLIKKYNKLTQV